MTVVSAAVFGLASAPAGASAQRHCPSVFGGASSAPIAYRPGFVHITVKSITCAKARRVILAAFRSPNFRSSEAVAQEGDHLWEQVW